MDTLLFIILENLPVMLGNEEDLPKCSLRSGSIVRLLVAAHCSCTKDTCGPRTARPS
jgi:hypothetical protein